MHGNNDSTDTKLTKVILLQCFDSVVAMIREGAFDDGFYIVPPPARIRGNGALLQHQGTDATGQTVV
jgi:hypothetical protein